MNFCLPRCLSKHKLKDLRLLLFPFVHPAFSEQVLSCKSELFLLYLNIMGHMCVFYSRKSAMKEAEREREMTDLEGYER